MSDHILENKDSISQHRESNCQESPEFPYRDQQRIREASEEKKYQNLFRDPLSASAQDSPKLLVDIILDIILFEEGNYFAQDYDERLYFYHRGVYREVGDQFVRGRVKAILEDRALSDCWTTKLSSGVTEYLRINSPLFSEWPFSLDVVNVLNGLVEIYGPELIGHTPSLVSPVQIPVAFDPDAKCPRIDRIIREVFPEDTLALPYELAGNMLIGGSALDMPVMLLGPDDTGKEAFLTLLKMFVGSENTASISLHQLEADRFSLAGLKGKLVNIYPNLPREPLMGTSIFKGLTGGDLMTAEYKTRENYDFYPFARHLFSASSFPRTMDYYHGYHDGGSYDGWVIVPFSRHFDWPLPLLKCSFDQPSELSGFLNQALEGLKRFWDNGHRYTVSTSMLEAKAEIFGN